MTTSGPDPYGDFSFEEVGGEVPPAPSATASDPAPDEGPTKSRDRIVLGDPGGYSDEATQILGMTRSAQASIGKGNDNGLGRTLHQRA